MAPSLLSLLLLPIVANGLALPPWVTYKAAKNFGLSNSNFKATQAASPDVPTENWMSVSRAENMTSRSSVFFDNMRRVTTPGLYKRDHVLRRQDAPLTSAMGGAEYLVDISFGGQDVKAIVDTGSSDTWLIQEGYICTDSSNTPVDQSQCKFGPAYTGGFTSQIQDQNFQAGYGDGEFVTGLMGYQNVTLGGITVPSAEIALVNRAYWQGDGITSGLIGLAYKQLTNAYSGTDPTKNSPSTRVPYDPLFTQMFQQGLTASSFSLALQRNNGGGYIAFGGLPPVTTTGDFASTALQAFNGVAGSAFTGQSFYTITPDALVFPGAASTQSTQYIVDSGTSLNYLPTNTARAINSMFSPKAVQNSGIWTVSCSARPPPFGVKIGGTTFMISAADMVFKDQASGQCVSAIQDGGAAPGPFVLGDQFLNNVVAVFDVGAAQMRFAVHNY